jgi:alkyl hydroperoxide reductase subunit AhpC
MIKTDRISSITDLFVVLPTGGTIPTTVEVKEDAPDKPIKLDTLTGKNILVLAVLGGNVHLLISGHVQVGVPGAFTDTCSRQIPGYIENYQKFKEKGVANIYVVTVNDVFVMK